MMIEQKLTDQNGTKQTERKEFKKCHVKKMWTQRPTGSHTQKFQENTKLKAMIYTQRTYRIK